MSRSMTHRGGSTGRRRSRKVAFVAIVVLVLALARPAAAGVLTSTTGDVSMRIPDHDPAGLVVPLPVVAPGATVVDVDLSFRIDHSFTSDLDFTLISPAGTSVEIVSDVGGSGDNFGTGAPSCGGVQTVIDDEASEPIATAAAPFAGSHRPEVPLSHFDGQHADGTWALRVSDDARVDIGTLYCATLTIELSGSSGGTPDARVSPERHDFGGVRVGTASPSTVVTLTSSGTAPLRVASVALGGADSAAFGVSSDRCSGQTVAPGRTCSFAVTFTPTSHGPKSAQVTVSSDAASGPDALTLSGIGLQADAQLSPGRIEFGRTYVGLMSDGQVVAVTNAGDADLALRPLTVDGPGSAEFAIGSDTCSDAVLAPGGRCEADVYFHPNDAGDHSAIVRIAHDGPGDSLRVDLSGTASFDTTPPTSSFTGPDPALLVGRDDRVLGEATDSHTFVRSVSVIYTSVTPAVASQTVAALLECSSSRCTWTAVAPPPGIWIAAARAVDAVGNVEHPGPSVRIVRVAA